MHHKCPGCGRQAVFERRKRTLGLRLKTMVSTFRPHSCNECGREILIDVHRHAPKDTWFAVLVVVGGGLMLGAFAMLFS